MEEGLLRAVGTYLLVIGLPKWTSFGTLEENHPNNLAKVIGIVVGMLLLLDVFQSALHKMNGMRRLGLTVATTAASYVIFHIVIIFFGAPVLDLVKQTVLLAVLLAVLGVMPLASVLNSSNFEDYVDIILRQRWRNHRERQATCSLVGTILGAYLGALLLPLDWDRPWQQWPLPCIYGAVYGHIVGVIVALILNVQKRFVKRDD